MNFLKEFYGNLSRHLYLLGVINICTKSLVNPFYSCWDMDQSGWPTDWLNDLVIPRATRLAELQTALSVYFIGHHNCCWPYLLNSALLTWLLKMTQLLKIGTQVLLAGSLSLSLTHTHTHAHTHTHTKLIKPISHQESPHLSFRHFKNHFTLPPNKKIPHT